MENYFVVICGDKGFPGHAFISFGRESDTAGMSISDGAFGMYPKNSASGIKSAVIGEVPGGLRDDYLRNKDHSLVIKVTQSEYESCLIIRDSWRTKKYELLKNDCLSFVIEIANELTSYLEMPQRSGFDNLPAEFVSAIILKNK